MSVEPALRDDLLAAIPHLRAFAVSLTHDGNRADDLVQDTIVRAWGNIHRFQRGTNLNAWLFTILRNLFHTEHRKKKREVDDPDGFYAATLKTAPDQQSHLDFEVMRIALAKLRPDQREVLLLAAAEGLPYEEIAVICGTAVGTVKSRVNRARIRLGELLHHGANEVGPDRFTKAAIQRRW